MLEKQSITSDEALRLLEALQPTLQEHPLSPDRAGTEPVARTASVPDFQRFRLLSYIPFAAALVILASSVFGTYALYRAADSQVTAWFVVLLIVAVLALLFAALTLWMAAAPWLHVRVRDHAGHRIAISLPLPLRLAHWGLRLAHRFARDETTAQLDAAADMVEVVRTSLRRPFSEPISVNVDDEGEHVEVYIG